MASKCDQITKVYQTFERSSNKKKKTLEIEKNKKGTQSRSDREQETSNKLTVISRRLGKAGAMAQNIKSLKRTSLGKKTTGDLKRSDRRVSRTTRWHQ